MVTIGLVPPVFLLSPPVQLAGWAHMHRLLSVVCCLLSVWTGPKVVDNNSYLRKYWSQDPEILPKCTAFIWQYVKNMNYTLKKLSSQHVIFVKIHASLAPLLGLLVTNK